MKVGSCERDEKRLSEGRSVAEESACCVSVRARQREEVGRAKGHRCVGPSVRERSGKGKDEKRARRVQPARSGGDDVDDGRIIHSDVQKTGGERVLCVCACATERGGRR